MGCVICTMQFRVDDDNTHNYSYRRFEKKYLKKYARMYHLDVSKRHILQSSNTNDNIHCFSLKKLCIIQDKTLVIKSILYYIYNIQNISKYMGIDMIEYKISYISYISYI